MSFVEREMFISPNGRMDAELILLQSQIFLAMGIAYCVETYPDFRDDETDKAYRAYFKVTSPEEVAEEIKNKLHDQKCIVIENKFPYDEFKGVESRDVRHFCLWWDSTKNDLSDAEIKTHLIEMFDDDVSMYVYQNLPKYRTVGSLSHVQVFVKNSVV